jgi:hypothetical protein
MWGLHARSTLWRWKRRLAGRFCRCRELLRAIKGSAKINHRTTTFPGVTNKSFHVYVLVSHSFPSLTILFSLPGSLAALNGPLR